MAPYLTADQVRDRVPSLRDSDQVPDTTIEDLVAEFAEIVARYRGATFAPTVHTEQVHPADGVLIVAHYPLTGIATIDGDTPTDSVRWDSSGAITGGCWPNPVEVVYTAGTATPALLLRVCCEYVRVVVEQELSGTSRDVIAQTIDGTVTRYSTPNWEQGRPTGWSEIDRALNTLPDYRLPGVG